MAREDAVLNARVHAALAVLDRCITAGWWQGRWVHHRSNEFFS